MSVSDAQFLQWLRGSPKIAILAELNYGYQNAGAAAEGTVYFAAAENFVDTSVSPVRPYADRIASAPVVERAIDAGELGGRSVGSISNIVLNNADGGLDYLLDYILDGRDCALYIGDPTWARSDFRKVGVGVVASLKADNDETLTIVLRDRGLLADATVIGDAMTTGPNAGKPKPLIFGQTYNLDLTQALYDALGPSYYFNSYAQDSSAAYANVLLRDAGGSLVNAGFSGDNTAITANAGTDTISYTAHGLNANDVVRFTGTTPFTGLTAGVQYWVLSSGLTANNFKVSTTRGGSAVDITGTTFSGTMRVDSRRYYVDAANAAVTLSSSPSGRLTGDVLAQGTSGDAAIQNIPHAAMRYLLDTYTKLTSSDRDATSFAALVAAEQAAGKQWGRAVLDRTNVLDLLDEIAIATCSWYGFGADGKLRVGKLDLANLDSAMSIDSIGVGDILGDASYEVREIKFGKMVLDANKNVAVQPDGLLSSVSAADKSKWGQQYQTRVKTTDPGQLDYLEDPWLFHKSAIDSPPVETAFVGSTSAAQALVDERWSLMKPHTVVFGCTVRLDKYALNQGDCVSVTYPRYGLSGGKNFRVLSVHVKASDNVVELELVRQTTPNWDVLGTGVGVPNAPTIGTAVAKYQKAQVAFTAPVNNGGAAILDYTATSSPGGFTGTGSSSPLTVTGLTNGVAYTFTVTARNVKGSGTASAASNSVTPTTVAPDPPTSVSATVSGTTATASFTAPADNGGSAITSYTATATRVDTGTTVSNSGATSPINIAGLDGGAQYTVKVTATNAIGTSAASSASNSITTSARVITFNGASTASNIFAEAGYPADVVNVTVTYTGDVVGVCSSGAPAIDTGLGWNALSQLTIVLGTSGSHCTVIGAGGKGGAGAGDTVGYAGGAGYNGIYLRFPATIDMTYCDGLWGGGGGGGGSGSSDGHGGTVPPASTGPGGGGAGYGDAGDPNGGGTATAGGRTTNGAGALGGGSGGLNGADGHTGSGGAPGGAAGYYLWRNGYAVTWIGYDVTKLKGSLQ